MKPMFTILILCSLSIVVGGDAQNRDLDKPVWTLEFIKVSPEKYGPTLGDLARRTVDAPSRRG